MSRRRVMVPVALLYGLACALPAVYFDAGGPSGDNFRLGSPTGLAALTLGWIPPTSLAWAANFPFFIGCFLLLRRRYRAAEYAGWVASLLGLTTWALVVDRAIPALLPGYYLWQASFVVLALGAKSLAHAPSKAIAPEV